MSKIFSNNIALLECHASNVLRHISHQPRHADTKHNRLELHDTKCELPSLLVNGKAIHSTYNPRRESDKVVKSLATSLPLEQPHYTFVIYEIGLGYYIDSLIEQCPSPAMLLIIINDKDVFEYTINNRSIASWFGKHEVALLFQPTPHQLTTKLQSYAFTHIEELYVPALITADHRSIALIQNAIKGYKTRQTGNRNTTAKFGALWVRNVIKNARQLDSVGGYIDISLLRNAFANIPAVIVGAGPSVDTLLDVLQSLSRSCILIAVDTVARTLQLHDINPHFIVNVDPQYWNAQHLQQVVFEHSVLIHDICTHPVETQSANPRIVMWSAVPIAQLFQTSFGIARSVSAGGSVTTSAWEVARWFGCSRAYLVGVDFAFPWNAIHCNDSLFEQDMLANGDVLNNAETGLLRYLHHAPTQHALDYRDNTVLTNQSLMTYAHWLNAQHIQTDSMPTYTLSPYSLKLDSIRYLDPNTISLTPIDIPNIIRTTFDRSYSNMSVRNNETTTSKQFAIIPILTAILSDISDWLQQNAYRSVKNCIDTVNELVDNQLRAVAIPHDIVSMLRDTVFMLCHIPPTTQQSANPNLHRHITHTVRSTLRQLALLKV